MKAVDELAKRFEPSIGKPPVCMTSREALVGREEGLRETATRPECSTSLAPRQRDDGQLHRRKEDGAGWKDFRPDRIHGVQQHGGAPSFFGSA
jgi:hypothetical protein